MVAALQGPNTAGCGCSLCRGGTCAMSFRGRLRLFFALIVVVPMIALGIVLFALTGRTETGKADAGIAAGTRTAIGTYREEGKSAEPALRRLARDQALHRAIASGRTGAAERRLRELAPPR